MQGPNNSHWKSHPYLTSKFTGESDTLHPQWVVMDLRAEKPLNAVQIGWANPYAKVYQVDYWVGRSPLGRAPDGQWKTFPGGVVKDGKGGTVNLKLAPDSVTARFVRVWMTESSNTCDVHGSDDIRNCVGYGIQDFKAGTIDAGRRIFGGSSARQPTRLPRSTPGIRRPTSTPREAASTPGSTSSSPAASPTTCPR